MHRIGFVCVIVIQLLSAASEAEEGCEKFAWSLSRERAWFAASEKAAVVAGESLTAVPNAAFNVRLQPASEASFVLPPERKPRSDGGFGGIVRLPALDRAGIYQITVSDEAWIDVVQDDRYARSVGSTGRSDCSPAYHHSRRPSDRCNLRSRKRGTRWRSGLDTPPHNHDLMTGVFPTSAIWE